MSIEHDTRRRIESEILHGPAVLRLGLPITTTGLALVSDFVERMYGTGETSLSFEGDTIAVCAPREGFGPLKAKGKKPRRPQPTDTLVTSAEFDGEKMKISYADAAERIEGIVEAQHMWFDTLGAVNYVEADIAVTGSESEFMFTLQKKVKPTAHDLRLEAEARVASAIAILEAAVERAGAGDAEGSAAFAEVLEALKGT